MKKEIEKFVFFSFSVLIFLLSVFLVFGLRRVVEEMNLLQTTLLSLWGVVLFVELGLGLLFACFFSIWKDLGRMSIVLLLVSFLNAFFFMFSALLQVGMNYMEL